MMNDVQIVIYSKHKYESILINMIYGFNVGRNNEYVYVDCSMFSIFELLLMNILIS